jgi:hypothetical protein
MRTIGKRYHGPVFNFATLCGDCGTKWHRSDLKLCADGLLRCRYCIKGPTAFELDQANAEADPAYTTPTGKTREFA